MIDEIDKGLSEFIISTEILYNADCAEIIVAYFDGHPIRLIGFSTNKNKSEFEIKEAGYIYYNVLKNNVAKT